MAAAREPWFDSPFRARLRERGGDVILADLLARRRRPWREVLYDTAIEESRERPGQLRITRCSTANNHSQTTP